LHIVGKSNLHQDRPFSRFPSAGLAARRTSLTIGPTRRPGAGPLGPAAHPGSRQEMSIGIGLPSGDDGRTERAIEVGNRLGTLEGYDGAPRLRARSIVRSLASRSALPSTPVASSPKRATSANAPLPSLLTICCVCKSGVRLHGCNRHYSARKWHVNGRRILRALWGLFGMHPRALKKGSN